MPPFILFFVGLSFYSIGILGSSALGAFDVTEAAGNIFTWALGFAAGIYLSRD